MRLVRIQVLEQRADGSLQKHLGWREVSEAQYQRYQRRAKQRAEKEGKK